MEKRMTKMTLAPEGEPIFSERAFDIEIVDEAGGEFLIVRCNMSGHTTISIDLDEWDSLKSAINEMVALCRT